MTDDGNARYNLSMISFVFDESNLLESRLLKRRFESFLFAHRRSVCAAFYFYR